MYLIFNSKVEPSFLSHRWALYGRLAGTESIWAVDLSPTKSYWERQYAGQGVEDWLPQVLKQGADQRAILCRHPWVGLCLFVYMKRRSLDGLLLDSSPFGQRFLCELQWDDWLFALKIHLDYYPYSQKERSRLKRFHQRQQASVWVLGFLSPWEAFLKVHKDFRERWTRRFGTESAFLLQQLFAKKCLREFPFFLQDTPSVLSVCHELEDPVVLWDTIWSFCIQSIHKIERLLPRDVPLLDFYWEIEWTNGFLQEVHLHFRRPYYLSQDKQYKELESLFRLLYFHTLKKQKQDKLDEASAFLQCYTLRCVYDPAPQPEQASLFEENAESKKITQTLSKIQQDIWQYDLRLSWLNPFQARESGEAPAKKDPDQLFEEGIMRQHAAKKPFFLLSDPPLFAECMDRRQLVYLESLPRGKWWERRPAQKNESTVCDFYFYKSVCLLKEEGVYQVYGVYG